MAEAFLGRPLDGGPYPYVWLDALTQKVREGGRIVNVSVVVAAGVNAHGQREILGMDVGASMVRTIYKQLSPEEVHAQADRVIAQLQEHFPQAAEMLADALPDILAFTAFPVSHWQKLGSNNPLERLNKEIRRRTDVVGIFPNRGATRRLVGAVLAERHDEWAEGRRYLTFADDLDTETTPATNILEAAGPVPIANNINKKA